MDGWYPVMVVFGIFFLYSPSSSNRLQDFQITQMIVWPTPWLIIATLFYWTQWLGSGWMNHPRTAYWNLSWEWYVNALSRRFSFFWCWETWSYKAMELWMHSLPSMPSARVCLQNEANQKWADTRDRCKEHGGPDSWVSAPTPYALQFLLNSPNDLGSFPPI